MAEVNIAETEQEILRAFKLEKKTNAVYFCTEYPSIITQLAIERLIEIALVREIRRFRICLHQSQNEAVQEMIMVMLKPQRIDTLQTISLDNLDRTTSYHLIEGDMLVSSHDDKGIITDTYHLKAHDPSLATSIRLNAGKIRSIQVLSDRCIFIETASGPFTDEMTKWWNS